TFCEGSSCVTRDWPFEPIDVGPPPGLPLPLTSTATILPPSAPVIARQPATIEADLRGRIDWPALPATPDHLVLEVRVPQGPVVAEVALEASPPGSGHFAGQVTLSQAGDYVVQVAAIENPGPGDLFGTALRRLTVQPASTPVATTDTGTGLPDWWPAGLAVVGLLLAGLLLLRGARNAG